MTKKRLTVSSLSHIGTKRHSGRYPWGSGENQQRSLALLSKIDELSKKGISDKDIARGLKISINDIKAKRSIRAEARRHDNRAKAVKLREKGLSKTAIAKKMGVNESSVRNWLKTSETAKNNITSETVKLLESQVKEKKYIQVGTGIEQQLNISGTRLKTALSVMKAKGYTVETIYIDQLGNPGKKTTVKVLAKEGTTAHELHLNKDKIGLINGHTEDGGRSWVTMKPINNIDTKRVAIRYHEDGGTEKDGIIEIRKGVPELDMGNSRYAQVRIGVGGRHYLKGMAVYADNLPKGVDLIYNSNKVKGTDPKKVFKKQETIDGEPDSPIDVENPFGSSVRQKTYNTSTGEKKLSALNIVYEEGQWSEWSKAVSSQVLSKQPPALAKKQLAETLKAKKLEFEEISRLTNPIVKKRMLEAFADDVEASSVKMKAAALPRQGSHVILPISKIKENEIYAPNYKNGEKVVLIRYPHGGIFEIPELKVNNKNREAIGLIKNAKDAVGIHHKVAEKLSGADFDGDTVLVIPNDKGAIKYSDPLKGLKDYDPKIRYPYYKGMKVMTENNKQNQMGIVSNLITDMTIAKAPKEDIAKAVRHSMTVIDAVKHKLDYTRSASDNSISLLHKKYQQGGASTLISRAGSQFRVPERGREKINPRTGKKEYTNTNKSYTTPDKINEKTGRIKKGKTVHKQTLTKRILETDDAFSLSSGTKIEAVYATHANELKALTNLSRKIAVNTKGVKSSPAAKKTYAAEVASLKTKLDRAYANKPHERQAQLLGNTIVELKLEANKNMTKSEIKKMKGKALIEARARTKSVKADVIITDREWTAIQSGAVSNSTLSKIINNTDLDRLKQIATPRTERRATSGQASRIKTLQRSGYTQSEIAESLGISVGLISKTLKEV